jgi:hypothetical protein
MGLSMPEFLKDYGTEAQCEQALEAVRWPNGISLPSMRRHTPHYVLRDGSRKVFQCQRLSSSSLADCRNCPSGLQAAADDLVSWAIYLISQAKTGLSALALKRQLGVSYPTAWLIHHKLMQAMADREKNVICLKAKFKLMMLISVANVLVARLVEVPRTRCPL